MIHGHGGNIYELSKQKGCPPSDIIDMSSNVNPLGPPDGLMEYLHSQLPEMLILPPVDAGPMLESVSKYYHLATNRILAGNGTTQFIYTIPMALKPGNALIVAPTYADYADACAMHEIPVQWFTTQETDNFYPDLKRLSKNLSNIQIVFFCNPNNPTGVMVPPDALKKICNDHPAATFVIDESYLQFVKNGEDLSMIRFNLPNVIVLNSMSKIFRIPGLRVGFLISAPSIIDKFKNYMLPWSVNALAQLSVAYLMDHPEKTGPFIKATQQYL